MIVWNWRSKSPQKTVLIWTIQSEWLSTWLLFNANTAIFLATSWREQLNFPWDDDEVRFLLDQQVGFCIVVAHWNNSLQIDMLLHSDTLSWFRAIQSALSPYCCVLCGEATNTNFIVFGLTRSGLEPMIYRTPDEYANHYSTDAVHEWYFWGLLVSQIINGN
jgi:hypothetical protein